MIRREMYVKAWKFDDHSLPRWDETDGMSSGGCESMDSTITHILDVTSTIRREIAVKVWI